MGLFKKVNLVHKENKCRADMYDAIIIAIDKACNKYKNPFSVATVTLRDIFPRGLFVGSFSTTLEIDIDQELDSKSTTSLPGIIEYGIDIKGWEVKWGELYITPDFQQKSDILACFLYAFLYGDDGGNNLADDVNYQYIIDSIYQHKTEESKYVYSYGFKRIELIDSRAEFTCRIG